jgi:hypothetical protein
MPAEIHVDNEPTFEFTIKDEDGVVVDISGATTKEIIFKDPDGGSATGTASFTTDGVDGKMFVVAEADQLGTAGVWKWQGYVVLATKPWNTDVHEFRVHANL